MVETSVTLGDLFGVLEFVDEDGLSVTIVVIVVVEVADAVLDLPADRKHCKINNAESIIKITEFDLTIII